MNKAEVRRIIETPLARGNKTPGLFGFLGMLALKGTLELCSSVGEVVGILEENRGPLFQVSGLSDAALKRGRG